MANIKTGKILNCSQCRSLFYRALAEINRRGPLSFCSRKCFKAYKDKNAVWYKKRGKIHEHRLVAEQAIGRKLKQTEVVHHIDGNRRNNKPKNLQVISREEHGRIHGRELVKRKVRNTKGKFI